MRYLSKLIQKSLLIFLSVFLFTIFLTPLHIVYAQNENSGDTACSDLGLVVESGLDENITSTNSHQVDVRITDADQVKRLRAIHIKAFHSAGNSVCAFGIGTNCSLSTSDDFNVENVENGQVISLTLPSPQGNTSNSDPYRYVYVYEQGSGSNLCYLGNYNSQTSSTANPPDEQTINNRYGCGDTWTPNSESNDSCECTDFTTGREAIATRIDTEMCCGWNSNGRCSSTAPATTQPSAGNGGTGADGNSGGTGGTNESGASGGNQTNAGGVDSEDPGNPEFNVFGPDAETLSNLNPLRNSPVRNQLSSPGGIVSRILDFAFPLAGLILFAMIVWGGFEMLTSAATSKGVEAGRQRVTNAIVGFIILFSSYWIIQIVQVVFGVAIL
ncbi:MAG: pilin [Patescibacteria group bacterium]